MTGGWRLGNRKGGKWRIRCHKSGQLLRANCRWLRIVNTMRILEIRSKLYPSYSRSIEIDPNRDIVHYTDAKFRVVCCWVWRLTSDMWVKIVSTGQLVLAGHLHTVSHHLPAVEADSAISDRQYWPSANRLTRLFRSVITYCAKLISTILHPITVIFRYMRYAFIYLFIYSLIYLFILPSLYRFVWSQNLWTEAIYRA